VQRRAIAWRKTDHVYPRPRLGEVLVRMGMISFSDGEAAASMQPFGVRLGEHLIELRKLSEENLYRALSVQAGIPAGAVDIRELDRLATRVLPAEASLRWKVLAFRVETGQQHVATADVPSQEGTIEPAKLCPGDPLSSRASRRIHPAGTQVSAVRGVTIWAPPACFRAMLRR
jgi:hypothetical protein